MNHDTEVLSLGPLSVRSQSAVERIRKRPRFLSDIRATYGFKGRLWPREAVLELKKYDESGTVTVQLGLADGDEEHTFRAEVEDGAVFFEQTQYMLSIYLPQAQDARLFSPIRWLCEAADWNPRSRLFSLPLNFGNDLGDFQICWEWLSKDGLWNSASLSGQVFSYKLNVRTHFMRMIKDVEERFKLINLELLRQTSWGCESRNEGETTPSTWLIIFQDVRETMTECFRRLTEEHRLRLKSEVRMLRPERIRKISPKDEERLAEVLKENPERRQPAVFKTPDADTPENRYMKQILHNVISDLRGLAECIAGKKEIAPIFKERLEEWSDDFSVLLEHRFWKKIGPCSELRGESLILSQDPLYAGICRSWFLLQTGLRLFIEEQFSGGISDASQLYEVWCLAEICSVVEGFGWEYVPEKSTGFISSEDSLGSGRHTQKSINLVYRYRQDESLLICISYQAYYGKKPSEESFWEGIMSTPTDQNPDIVLRLFRDDLQRAPVYTWIFDAKYRLDGDAAPEDALNQMHRYRDAVLRMVELDGSLVRESLGAFVLYPGKGGAGRQTESIKKTNIGAIPIRPSETGNENNSEALKKHLSELLKIDPVESFFRTEMRLYKNVPRMKKVPAFIVLLDVSHISLSSSGKGGSMLLVPETLVKSAGIPPAEWNWLFCEDEKNPADSVLFHVYLDEDTASEKHSGEADGFIRFSVRGQEKITSVSEVHRRYSGFTEIRLSKYNSGEITEFPGENLRVASGNRSRQ